MPNVVIPAPGKRRGRPSGKVTDKQAVWIAEYLKDMNGARAATVAGYRHPAVAAAKLLNPDLYPHVVAEVQRRLAEKRKVCEIDARHLVAELAKVAFLDPRRLFKGGEPIPFHMLPSDVAVALARWVVTWAEEGKGAGAVRVRRMSVRFHSKLTALRLIAELLGYRRAPFVTTQNDNEDNVIGLTTEAERREAILSLLRAGGQGSAEGEDVIPNGLKALPTGKDDDLGPLANDVPPLF